MDAVIKVEDLSKKFIIRHQNVGKHDALRDVIAYKSKELFTSAGKVIKRQPVSVPRKEEFWALKDLNFEVTRGDRLGIIGRNGAGKSTLLKILSRITEPTKGKISISGRVSSLLEVGTGFHPELSGRENIFLNGAILGMKREEIKRKFDEIVDFSGVEKFLDTPVKRYSSGMYVRLAFAVAAHLETEILVVDEVLAVGDSEFQKKCLSKMEDISSEYGRTVLFVSHNMQAISNLCSRVILLNKGSVVQDSSPSEVIRNYLMFESTKAGEIEWTEESAPGDEQVKLRSIKVLDQDQNVRNHFFSDTKAKIQMVLELAKVETDLVIGFDLKSEDGVTVFRTYQNDDSPENWPELHTGINSLYCEIPGGLLNSGTYFICPKVSYHCKKWIINGDPLLSFDIELNHGVSPFWNALDKSNRPGLISPILSWRSANTHK